MVSGTTWHTCVLDVSTHIHHTKLIILVDALPCAPHTPGAARHAVITEQAGAYAVKCHFS